MCGLEGLAVIRKTARGPKGKYLYLWLQRLHRINTCVVNGAAR
jgi:hypothetical protein